MTMQHELLLEIGTEEIPAGFIVPAVTHLQNSLTNKLAELKITHGAAHMAATPRRLAVCVENLQDRQPDTQEEVMGPPKKAAFDDNNQPTQAAIGFAKSRGVSVDDLEVVATPRGEYLMLRQINKGKPTLEILAAVLPELIQGIPFPKSMRWGGGSLAFARPIHWLVGLYKGKVVDFVVDDTKSGNTTFGHRFMDKAPIKVADYAQYVNKLEKAAVIVDLGKRRQAVLKEIHDAAQMAGGNILSDEDLVDTVVNLVEKPHAVCGTFEQRFLELPRDVLITSMREHQKYFSVVNDHGELLPYFVAINNTHVKDQSLAAEGHQRVLRARLEDAFFFFKEDRKKTLSERVDDLAGVIFQAKLGTMLEKTKRIQTLAGIIAADLAPDLEEHAKRAALLTKADLMTEMVNEFPTLQGTIGQDYARLNGEPEAVAAAVKEHYMPVRAGGELPQSLLGRLVGIADRLDTIAGCFGIGQVPTGTTDPFGLRRQAVGLLHIIENGDISFSLSKYLAAAVQLYDKKITEPAPATTKAALDFIKGRFHNDLMTKNIPAETVEAVTSITFDDPADCRKKIDALHALSSQPSFTLLAGSFKRVMNIIKGHEDTAVDEKLLHDAAEKKLHEKFKKIAAEVTPLIKKRMYSQAMEAILQMKEAVDLFFDEVLVMVDDKKIRHNRLSLLAAIAQLFLKIGDFSKMYALNQ